METEKEGKKRNYRSSNSNGEISKKLRNSATNSNISVWSIQLNIWIWELEFNRFCELIPFQIKSKINEITKTQQLSSSSSSIFRWEHEITGKFPLNFISCYQIQSQFGKEELIFDFFLPFSCQSNRNEWKEIKVGIAGVAVFCSFGRMGTTRPIPDLNKLRSIPFKVQFQVIDWLLLNKSHRWRAKVSKRSESDAFQMAFPDKNLNNYCNLFRNIQPITTLRINTRVFDSRESCQKLDKYQERNMYILKKNE